jgi:hypothetical protein
MLPANFSEMLAFVRTRLFQATFIQSLNQDVLRAAQKEPGEMWSDARPRRLAVLKAARILPDAAWAHESLANARDTIFHWAAVETQDTDLMRRLMTAGISRAALTTTLEGVRRGEYMGSWLWLVQQDALTQDDRDSALNHAICSPRYRPVLEVLLQRGTSQEARTRMLWKAFLHHCEWDMASLVLGYGIDEQSAFDRAMQGRRNLLSYVCGKLAANHKHRFDKDLEAFEREWGPDSPRLDFIRDLAKGVDQQSLDRALVDAAQSVFDEEGVVALLLSLGADPEARPYPGVPNDTLTEAERRGNTEAAELIRAAIEQRTLERAADDGKYVPGM